MGTVGIKPGVTTVLLPTGETVPLADVLDFQLRFCIRPSKQPRFNLGWQHNENGNLICADGSGSTWQSPCPAAVAFDPNNGTFSVPVDGDRLIIAHLACSSVDVELRIYERPADPVRSFSGPLLRDYRLLQPIVLVGARGRFITPILTTTSDKPFTLDLGCIHVKGRRSKFPPPRSIKADGELPTWMKR